MPQNLQGIHGVDDLIVAVGEGGKLLHWTGDNYEPLSMPSPTKCNLCAVHVQDARTAWAVGDRGTILRWDGRQWLPLCLGTRASDMNAVWASKDDGQWFGGRGILIQHHGHNGHGGTAVRSDFTVTSIWGSGPDDVWFLCAGGTVLHWNGTTCAPFDLPVEEDDELYCIAGSAVDEDVYAVGTGGLLLRCDGETWTEMDSGTPATLSGIVAAGPDSLWVTSNDGQLRHWNGRKWSVEAFSAFGWLGSVCIARGLIWAVGARGVVLQHRPGK